ncbi:energy transducer TonB family protein [Hymenobacter lucidus]|uniref:Energy transducer TonB n=1 Tax=Hymenobacter lucidus TaxID=2880930 RepID=A0ABS8AX75_9BACT|nr:energy transducer TonB [Hymenobacter lucidus]MCB2410389.1 energy transducer TonB [Hymenobacter lucidus]
MFLQLRFQLLGAALLLLPVFAKAQTSYNRWEAQPPAPVAKPTRPATNTPPARRAEGTVEVVIDSAAKASGKLTRVEIVPEFPGGSYNYHNYVRKFLKRPKGPRESGIVQVTFTVLKSGAVTDAHVKPGNGINAAYDAAAVELMSKAPRFTPGRREGGIADMELTYPVEFR